MAAFTCCLDSRTGRLPHSEQPSFIYRVKAGDTVQFQLDSASDLNSASTSLLLDLGKYDQHSDFHRIRGERTKLKHWLADVTFPRAGTYTLMLEYAERATGMMKRSQEDYIVVDPALVIGGEPVPLDSLVIQTVLSRSLGPYTRWEEVLMRQKALGYNLIHFTPIQELGFSQSLYSLGDQLRLNSALFPGLSTDEEQFEALTATLGSLDSQGIGSCVDFVLKHMAVGSEFLEACPDAGYTLESCPYLRAAYELDHALALFSSDFASDRVGQYKHGHVIDCERDLNNIMQIIRLELLPKLQLQDFFTIDPAQVLASLREAESGAVYEVPADWANCLKSKGLEAFTKQYALVGEGEGRKAVTVRTI